MSEVTLMLPVEVKPLPSTKWHGKKGKDSFAVPKVVEVLYSHELGKYATGLTEEEEKEYSKKLGVNLSAVFNPDEPHPYWPTKPAQIVLPNHTLILDPNKPQEFVKIKNLKASKFVANSMRSWENGEYPEATHVIFDESEEVNNKASKIAKKNSAIQKLASMTAEDKINVIQVVGNKSLKGRSDDFINVEINDIIENSPDEFLRVISMGREEVGNRAIILEAIYKGIINKESNGYFWMGEMIGFDLSDAAKWFADIKNQRVKLSILEKLTKAK